MVKGVGSNTIERYVLEIEENNPPAFTLNSTTRHSTTHTHHHSSTTFPSHPPHFKMMSLRSIARQAKFVLPAVQVGAVQMRSNVTKAAKKPVAKKWRKFSKKVKNSQGDRLSKAKKDKLASSGPVTARNLFVQKTMKGTKLTLKDVSTKWAALSTKQRGVLEAEAAKNKAKRTAIRKSLKTHAMNKWRKFPKKVTKYGDRESEKARIASSGPVTARNLFVQKTMKGTKLTLKDMNRKWLELSAQQRGVLEAEAAKNKAKRTAIRQSLKRPPSVYALFVKKHFTAEYAAAMKSGLPRKEAFATATRAVAKKYRSQ